MDVKFSSAIHVLILVSEAEYPMSSEQIAESVGTNASYIRKLTSRLSRAGIIQAKRGVSGFALTRSAKEISMLDIYLAVMECDKLHLFDLHQNPKDTCIVGQNIQPVLGVMFQEMERDTEKKLAHISLADSIEAMRRYIESKKN